MSSFYEKPQCLPPLGPDAKGAHSDHLMVVMKPICSASTKLERSFKKISYRPIHRKGMQKCDFGWKMKSGVD